MAVFGLRTLFSDLYFMVKLLGASLKKAVRNRVENRYMGSGIFENVTSWGLFWW